MSKLHTRATEIVQYLDGWKIEQEESEHYAHLVRADGAGIHIKGNGYNYEESQRLEITGKWPAQIRIDGNLYSFYPSYRNRDNPRITVAKARSNAAIAKDIERRFLPKYLPLYAEMLEYRQGVLDNEARRLDSMTELATVAGGKARRGEVRIYRSNISGQLRPSYDGGKVDIKLSVPWALGLEIAALLKEHR